MIDRRPAPGLMIEQQAEGVVQALLACGEARGEQDGGGRLESLAMAGVLWTPRNRARRPRWRARSLREIILERWQFSCFNVNDPNRDKLLDLWKTDPVSWERADTLIDLLEEGLLMDPTGGATHYVRLEMWNRAPLNPAKVQWFEAPEISSGRTQELRRLGSHVFAIAP